MVTTPEVTKLGLEYTDIIFAGSILFILVVALNSLLHAEGDTKSYRNVLILSFFINLIHWYLCSELSIFLIFNFYPIIFKIEIFTLVPKPWISNYKF